MTRTKIQKYFVLHCVAQKKDGSGLQNSASSAPAVSSRSAGIVGDRVRKFGPFFDHVFKI